MHEHAHIFAQTLTYVHTHTHTHTHMYTQQHTCMYTCTSAHAHAHTHTITQTHKHMHTGMECHLLYVCHFTRGSWDCVGALLLTAAFVMDILDDAPSEVEPAAHTPDDIKLFLLLFLLGMALFRASWHQATTQGKPWFCSRKCCATVQGKQLLGCIVFSTLDLT